MLDAGEVGLGRVGKEVVGLRVDLIQQGSDFLVIDAHLRRDHRRVGDDGAMGAGKLADAIDRIMVVKGEQIAAAGGERVGFADQFEGAAGVLGEDADIFSWIGVEKFQYPAAGCVHPMRHGLRGGVGGMRVAENVVQ